MRIFDNPNLNFLKWRWHALILSLLLCAAGWPEARLGLVANVVIAVGTWLQRDIAERAAAGAPGIRRVDNLITVEPPIEKEED